MKTLIKILRWVFGVLFILVAVTSFSQVLVAITSFVIGLILIPITMNFIQNRIGYIKRSYKITALAILVVVFLVALPPAEKSDEKVSPTQEQTQNSNLESRNVNSPISTEETKSDDKKDEETKSEENKAQEKEQEQKPEASTKSVPAVNLVPAAEPKKTETPKPAVSAKSSCDPNYSGCVPIASDVDCAGGSGDGPAYTGRVNVIGSDIYGLDRDKNGVACE